MTGLSLFAFLEIHMAHEINRMMYAGEVPWHGLGVQLPKNGTYDEIAEVFYEAGERDLVVAGTNQVIPDRKALVRNDTEQYLATVGRDYGLLQFRELAATLVEAAGGVKAIFHTAGLLGPTGVKGWLLGELGGEPITVKGDESPIRRYLLGFSGHDGLTALVIKNTPTRVVCANTLNIALRQSSSLPEWRIMHCSNAKARLDQAGRAFKELVTAYDQFGELANVLATTAFTDKQMMATVDAVLPLPKDDHTHPKLEKAREKVFQLFETGIGVGAGIRGTSWAAMQSWSEYADHHRPIRLTRGEGAQSARLESIWMGRAAGLKQQALDAVVAEAGIHLAAA